MCINCFFSSCNINFVSVAPKLLFKGVLDETAFFHNPTNSKKIVRVVLIHIFPKIVLARIN